MDSHRTRDRLSVGNWQKTESGRLFNLMGSFYCVVLVFGYTRNSSIACTLSLFYSFISLIHSTNTDIIMCQALLPDVSQFPLSQKGDSS